MPFISLEVCFINLWWPWEHIEKITTHTV